MPNKLTPFAIAIVIAYITIAIAYGLPLYFLETFINTGIREFINTLLVSVGVASIIALTLGKYFNFNINRPNV